MKTLGIIGGIAPESTVAYYRALIAKARERTGGSYPRLLINSIEMPKMLGLAGAQQFDDLTAYLLGELAKLDAAGADLALFASNTPHIVFDQVNARTPLPLLSIVDATAREVRARGFRRVALFGTRFTMQAGFYARVLARDGVEVVLPSAEDQELIHSRYMDELVNARFLPETRDAILAVLTRLPTIDAVILGGTELPLLLTEPEYNGVTMLDTMAIHVDAAVDAMLA